MCEARKISAVHHVIKMIKEDDKVGLLVYRDAIEGDERAISELNSDLDAYPDARELIMKKAPYLIMEL